MAQDIGHVLKARAVVDHLGGDRMAEDMAGDSRGDHEAGAGKRLPHDGPHCRTCQRAKRRPTVHKDLAAGTLRSPTLQVGHNRLANIVWQG